MTASQVPGSGGALALYLLPRYLLINTLDVPIQYKQQARVDERRATNQPAWLAGCLLPCLGHLLPPWAHAARRTKPTTAEAFMAACTTSDGTATCLQGTAHERELAAGASRALRWADLLRPLRLSVRVQEAGWMWSGGFELDSPGDLFIKIRRVRASWQPRRGC